MRVEKLGLLLLSSIVIGASALGNAGTAEAAKPQADMFYNYYQGGGASGEPTAMYPAPLSSVPSRVGHTHVTYQPLMPHEFLYPHARRYSRYDSALSPLPVNTTKVKWMHRPLVQGRVLDWKAFNR